MTKVLILRAPGINRDADAAAACELAGAQPERVHINQVAMGAARLADYGMLIVPGGFSYGDHLGAGKLLAVDLVHRLGEQLQRFVADGRLVLGICNGFQVLVKAGVLPGADSGATTSDESTPLHESASVTLTDNESTQFECRWVRLAADPTSRCVFTRNIDAPIEVPVAHGEGRIAVRDEATLARLQARGQVALRYVGTGASPVEYPANPNGSVDAIAGLCNAEGTVLGLMPHPEDAVVRQQHPRWTREPWRTTGDGLALFQNAVAYLRG